MHLIDNINLQWRQIFHALKKLSKPILNDLGLTKVDANILLVLANKDKATKGELAQFLSFEPSSLTRSMDRLIELGLIKRLTCADDHRCIRLSLTPKGKALIKQYSKRTREVWTNALTGLDSADMTVLDALLQKIYFNLYQE